MTLVRLSVLLGPASEAASKSGATVGVGGAEVSTCTWVGLEAEEILPA